VVSDLLPVLWIGGFTAGLGATGGGFETSSAPAATTSSGAVFGVENWWDSYDFGELASGIEVGESAAGVDWNALGSAWEGALAESAAQNAVLESSFNWGGLLDGAKTAGAQVLGRLVSSGLFGRDGAAPATRPTGLAPGSSSLARAPAFGAPGVGGALGLTPAQSQLVTLGLLALGAVLVVKSLGK